MVWMFCGLSLLLCLPASHRTPKRVHAVTVLCSLNILCGQLFHDAGRHTISFLGNHQPTGHELTARINLLPVKKPDASLERNIHEIEKKRTRDEGKVFEQVGVYCFRFKLELRNQCMGRQNLKWRSWQKSSRMKLRCSGHASARFACGMQFLGARRRLRVTLMRVSTH